ncbi:MAG TPA: glycoside hydrolase family 3 N-terminal domain-containing protein [Acidobacteriaceae bacterium]|nr:glycoside hydrolase family 3 N-terminal domain-containing protein [Acidobacteriaceae bacterium]
MTSTSPTRSLLVLFLMLTVALTPVKAQPGQPVPPNAQLADKKVNERVEALLKKMTLEEKVGQLTQYSAGTRTGPGTGRADYLEMAAKGQVGSLFNATGAAKTNEMQRAAVEKSRLHIPLMFGLDVIHGFRTTYPVPLGMAATFDPQVYEAATHMAAVESRSAGINFVFSPMVDIARDARWGRIVEGAGEDTYLGSVLARAQIRGYQGNDVSAPDAVAACVKHFAAYGAAIAGREYYTTDMSELSLRQDYLPPYKAAIDAGAVTVMSAFNALNGVPASANPFTLTEILRGEWGFQGFVDSDWTSVKELIAHGIALDGATAARKALTAGVEMDMESGLYQENLAALVHSGAVPPAVVDEAVRRVLRVKFAMGLFEHPYTDEKAELGAPSAAHREIARKAAEESFVLLKNDKHALPLTASAKTIALIGPLADSQQDMLGSWQGAGRPEDAVTLKTALEARVAKNGGHVVYEKATAEVTNTAPDFSAAVNAAKSADVVVLALGETASTMTGEAGSRAHLHLPGHQEQLLRAVVAAGKPTVLVVFSGRPLVLKWADRNVGAIVEAWFPGVEAGPALVNVLYGDVNFSGKLPSSFPRAVGQEPLYYNQLPTGRPVPPDVDLSHPPVGQEKYFSRYIDVENSPLYAFGHGLSYTQFAYSDVAVSKKSVEAGLVNTASDPRLRIAPANLQVTATVRNTGPVAGTEVVQLYTRVLGASVEEPVRELKGFERVTLQPGESKKVTFTLGFDQLAYYTADLKRTVEAGTQYTVFVGGSSEATEQAGFTVTP